MTENIETSELPLALRKLSFIFSSWPWHGYHSGTSGWRMSSHRVHSKKTSVEEMLLGPERMQRLCFVILTGDRAELNF